MRVGQARKRDGVERGIVAALRALGIEVILVSGAGAPDAILYHPRAGVKLVEFKSQGGKLTPAQEAMHARLPVSIVRTVDDAMALFRLRR